nr:hypothetical protein [Micromonospora sp. DSM 115978]
MTYRVVQWTTGIVGASAVRAMIDHPELDLVGCFAHTPDKVGQDVGTLCGVEPIGVLATNDVEALIALAPDCVTYMPRQVDVEHVVRLLEAGVNVVTTAYSLTGTGFGEHALARVTDAAAAGGSTIYSTGINPGQANVLALAAAAVCSRVERISVLESVDATGYESEKTWRGLGIGRPVDDPEIEQMSGRAMPSFWDAVRVMARGLAIELDEVRYHVTAAAATRDLDFGWMQIPAGHAAALKGSFDGMARGRAVIQLQFVWKLGDDCEPNWPVEDGY